jgi:hypothetical protein
VERSSDGGTTWTALTPAPARNNTGTVTYNDATVALGNTYMYRVAAVAGALKSAYAGPVTITVAVPAAPGNVAARAVRQGNNERITVTWSDLSSNESGFTIQRATNSTFTQGLNTVTVGPGVTSYTSGNIARVSWYVRVQATNVLGASAWVNATPSPVPAAP